MFVVANPDMLVKVLRVVVTYILLLSQYYSTLMQVKMAKPKQFYRKQNCISAQYLYFFYGYAFKNKKNLT